MTRPTWPSQHLRRAARHAFWRNRRAVRALLVALAVLCAMQAVAARAQPQARPVARAGGLGAPADALVGVPDPDMVTTVVRLADPSAGLLVRPGSVVDILAAPLDAAVGLDPGPSATAPTESTALAAVVASGVRVVGVPASDQSGLATTQGTVLLVAVTPTTARVLAAAASARLSMAVRSGGTAS
jgi:hypothetical protein